MPEGFRSVPAARMSQGNFEHIQSWHVDTEYIVDEAGLIPLTRTPQDINVVVVGGPVVLDVVVAVVVVA